MNTIHLQGIGTTKAKPAGDLKIGDVTVWNFGYLETIKAVAKESAAFITFTVEIAGREHTRRVKKSRLVGIQ